MNDGTITNENNVSTKNTVNNTNTTASSITTLISNNKKNLNVTSPTNSHNTLYRGNRGERKKRPLVFVSEGSADIATQKRREEQQQKRYENERLRRKRKSLQEQLRANAIKKQREFKKLVKKKESFNKLSKQELDYFQKIRAEEAKKDNELNNYLHNKINEFEIKKNILTENNQSKTNPGFANKTVVEKSVSPMSIGIVKKKQRKIGISIQKIKPKS